MTVTNMKLTTSGLEQRNRVTTNGASSIILELNSNSSGTGNDGGLFLVTGSLRSTTTSSTSIQVEYQLFTSEDGSGTALDQGFALDPDRTTGYWRFNTTAPRLNYWQAGITDLTQIGFVMDIDTWQRPDKFPSVSFQSTYITHFGIQVNPNGTSFVRAPNTLVRSIKFKCSSGNIKGEVSATPMFSPVQF